MSLVDDRSVAESRNAARFTSFSRKPPGFVAASALVPLMRAFELRECITRMMQVDGQRGYFPDVKGTDGAPAQT